MKLQYIPIKSAEYDTHIEYEARPENDVDFLETINAYYKPKLKQENQDHKVLGWETKESQLKRFEILTQEVPVNEKSVFDVGCGLGNLLEYFTDRNINTEYTGVDILPEMINRARKKFSGTQTRFICSNIFKDELFDSNTFDIIYSSGMFNINVGNNMTFLKEAILKFADLGKKHIIFNLLHKNSPDPEPDYWYYDPREVQRLIESLPLTLKKVSIITGYLENDFTVLLEL